MSALAFSEHGNVNSHAALEREAKAAGIKPIFGIEAYFGSVGEAKKQRKYHITLFAMNEEGYRNLNAIVTQSYIDSYYYPTVSPESLRKHAKGIVAFSGCADSFISCSLLGGKLLGDKRLDFSDYDYENVRRAIGNFTDIFEDRFYLEVQRFPGLDRTCVLNPAFARLSKDTGVPLIATADVHYPYPHQNEMQKLLHASRRQSTISVIEANWEYDILLTYPTSDEEITNDLVGTGLSISEARRAIQSTTDLAEQCTVELPKAQPLRFHIPGPVDYTPRQYLWQQLKAGWKHRCEQRPNLKDLGRQYDARLKKEMKVICDKDFCDYFLVVADLVQWAKLHDITVGPGRGSAAGSLVCYVLGITEIDPLHPAFSRMVFERFIDPTRSDMPDIDLDFDDELRHLVPERARKIYGPENVCNVANHTRYRGRSALGGVARAHGFSQKLFDPIGKRCAIRTETDDRVDDSIEDVINSYASDPEISELLAKFPDHIQQAIELEGQQHSMGVHAGGFVIASDPIPDVCPIYTKKNVQVIPYEKRDAEYLNMLKVDFLGLTTMGMLGLCRKWIGLSLDTLYSLFYGLSEEAMQNILEMFQSNDMTGVFQYEGGTTRQVTNDVQPATFDELAACNALSRPGPFYGGQMRDYIAVKRGEKDWKRIHATGFDRHVSWTYGQIVYQEQIMWILRDLAGFDIPTVLRVRKIIGKKLGEHQFTVLWTQFKDGCAANGVSENDALRVWGAITTAAGYAFNTSHAYSYALIAWWQMWFKINHAPEFYAANLAKNGDGKDDIPRRTALLKDAIEHEVEVWPFDVSVMTDNWQVGHEVLHGRSAIMPGFRQIPAIGENTANGIMERIETTRSRGRRVDQWVDLSQIRGIGDDTVVKMVEFCSQADPFGIHRTEQQLEVFRKQCADGIFAPHGLPAADEFADSKNLPQNNGYIAFVGLANNVVYRDEVESIRSRTGQTFEEIRAGLDDPEKTKKATVFAYDEFGEVALRVSRWRFDALQGRLAAIKNDHHVIVAYGRSFEDRPNSLQVSDLWLLEPD
jgi:DNA polymerase-3 subunit alpha